MDKAHKDFLSMEMSGFRSTPEAEDYRIQTMYLPFARFSNTVNGILHSADIYQKLHIGQDQSRVNFHLHLILAHS